MTTYNTYLFDLDGTLTDTSKIWLGIYRDALAHFGIKNLTDKEIAAHTHSWDQVVHLGLEQTDIPEFTKIAYKFCNERVADAPFNAGVEEMLDGLRSKGKTLGIFTAMDRSLLEPVIAQKGLNEKFDVVIAGSDVPNRKPHPDGILLALKQLNQEPGASVVYIGDKDTDIICGRSAGVDTILFFPPHHADIYDREPLKKARPHHEISEWRELLLFN